VHEQRDRKILVHLLVDVERADVEVLAAGYLDLKVLSHAPRGTRRSLAAA
jgi:hypothetical protein